ncbi:MAG: ATP synthase F1 subunit epsilon [Candidatus Aminicenantes bacterium]|nr:ATP synthase F1 subunit epsilon [Candidatus Aminicenantes bacterium]
MSEGVPATIHLKVVTPRRLLVEADVEAVFLPTLEGEIGVLPGHRPLFVGIGRGKLRHRSGGEEESVAIRGGYAQVQPEKVVVITEVGEDDGSG